MATTKNTTSTKAAAAPTLHGSSTLPAIQQIVEGKEISLGDLVRAAFDASGMSVDDWNAQSGEVIDEKLAAQMGVIRQAEIEASAAAASKDDHTGQEQAIKALRIVSMQDGFRRAGRAWNTAGDTVPLADLTDEQIAQLKVEPLLTVTEVELVAE